MDEPIDPSDAFGPEEINRLLDVDGLRKGVEIGWCNLPNGAGYIANTILYPERHRRDDRLVVRLAPA